MYVHECQKVLLIVHSPMFSVLSQAVASSSSSSCTSCSSSGCSSAGSATHTGGWQPPARVGGVPGQVAVPGGPACCASHSPGWVTTTRKGWGGTATHLGDSRSQEWAAQSHTGGGSRPQGWAVLAWVQLAYAIPCTAAAGWLQSITRRRLLSSIWRML